LKAEWQDIALQFQNVQMLRAGLETSNSRLHPPRRQAGKPDLQNRNQNGYSIARCLCIINAGHFTRLVVIDRHRACFGFRISLPEHGHEREM
jgi:hypothetical protein